MGTKAPRGFFLGSIDRWATLAEQVAPSKFLLERQPWNYERVLVSNIKRLMKTDIDSEGDPSD